MIFHSEVKEQDEFYPIAMENYNDHTVTLPKLLGYLYEKKVGLDCSKKCYHVNKLELFAETVSLFKKESTNGNENQNEMNIMRVSVADEFAATSRSRVKRKTSLRTFTKICITMSRSYADPTGLE